MRSLVVICLQPPVMAEICLFSCLGSEKFDSFLAPLSLRQINSNFLSLPNQIVKTTTGADVSCRASKKKIENNEKETERDVRETSQNIKERNKRVMCGCMISMHIITPSELNPKKYRRHSLRINSSIQMNRVPCIHQHERLDTLSVVKWT